MSMFTLLCTTVSVARQFCPILGKCTVGSHAKTYEQNASIKIAFHVQIILTDSFSFSFGFHEVMSVRLIFDNRFHELKK